MPDTAHQILPVYEHQEPRRRFERTLARGRLASTYLFAGPPGIGKRAFARLLSASLLCGRTGPTEFAACGECESCRLFAAGNHPDFFEVRRPKGKSTLPLELFIGDKEHRNQQGLCHDISLKPYLSGRRIAIIDDADYLSTESANCLLKTLEEPPPHSLLILIGASVSKQLPTIRSRCQIVRFSPLSSESVARVLQEQNLIEEDEDAQALAADSGGSVSVALAARDRQARAFQATLVTHLSKESFDPIRLATEAIAFAAEAGSEASARRDRLAGLIQDTLGFYRDAMLRSSELGTNPDAAIRCLELCLEAEQALARNANQATLVQTWLTNLWRAGRAAR